MRSHDVRRTGRASVNGPRAGDKVWSYTANDGVAINIEATATHHGVFFGTWGVVRRNGSEKTDWDKFDGKIYGLNRETGQPLWEPLLPSQTPYAYKYSGRAPTEQDQPAGPGLHWNFSNGTVEGTPAYDPKSGLLIVGRGDGRLFAIDPLNGKVAWNFETFDPARPTDPEGGGEIVGGPLVHPNVEAIIIATFAAPNRPDPPRLIRHETNAVYAVDRTGRLLWRYPAEGTLEQVFVAPPAFAPDLATAYAVTTLPDGIHPCEFLAFDVASGQLKWRLELADFGGSDIAVGIDGVVYVAGMRRGFLGAHPASFAVEDLGSKGSLVWGPTALEGIRPATHFSNGVALLESDDHVQGLYVTTTHTRNANGTGGKLHFLNPSDGQVLATWDPENAQPSTSGGLTDVSLDAEGVIYVGVRGRWKTLVDPAQSGRVYALRHSVRKKSFDVLWSHTVKGQIDWASPAIGPDGGLYFGSTSELSPLLLAVARGETEDVANADPMFYGIQDKARPLPERSFEILSVDKKLEERRLTIRWCSEPGRQYSIQWSEDLKLWTDNGVVSASAGSSTTADLQLEPPISTTYLRVIDLAEESPR